MADNTLKTTLDPDDPAYHGIVCLDCGWHDDAARLKIQIGEDGQLAFMCPKCLGMELDYALDR
jgi:hypothetical protein